MSSKNEHWSINNAIGGVAHDQNSYRITEHKSTLSIIAPVTLDDWGLLVVMRGDSNWLRRLIARLWVISRMSMPRNLREQYYQQQEQRLVALARLFFFSRQASI